MGKARSSGQSILVLITLRIPISTLSLCTKDSTHAENIYGNNVQSRVTIDFPRTSLWVDNNEPVNEINGVEAEASGLVSDASRLVRSASDMVRKFFSFLFFFFLSYPRSLH